MAYVSDKLSQRPEVWTLIDSMVLLEGERPLLQLCEHVEGKRELDDITNLIYQNEAGEVVKTVKQDPLDISTLPTPNFDGLPLTPFRSDDWPGVTQGKETR